MDVEEEAALTLEHERTLYMVGSPRIPPLFELAVKILTQEGESKLLFTLMYETLCPFE